jgi:AraC-like DNA-binding protein
MADELKLSPTTFRRRLEREGCAFQGIKDDVRRGIAQQKLRETDMSVVEIAALVGFQEPSAYHRAFKKWTA